MRTIKHGRILLQTDGDVMVMTLNDPGVLIAYAKEHYPTIFVDAKEPQIVYNSDKKTFEVSPGASGKGLDIKSFERALPDWDKVKAGGK